MNHKHCIALVVFLGLTGVVSYQGFKMCNPTVKLNTELPLKRLLRQPKLADRVLGQYVMDQHKQDSGAALSRVKHALLGCQHLIPQLRGKLCTAWENIRVWQEQRTSKLRPPMPVPVWVLMVWIGSWQRNSGRYPKR